MHNNNSKERNGRNIKTPHMELGCFILLTGHSRIAAPGDDRFILVSEFFSPEDANGYFAEVTIAIDSMPQTTSIESYRSQSIDIYRQDSNFEDLQLLSSCVGNFTLAAGAAAGGTENAT